MRVDGEAKLAVADDSPRAERARFGDGRSNEPLAAAVQVPRFEKAPDDRQPRQRASSVREMSFMPVRPTTRPMCRTATSPSARCGKGTPDGGLNAGGRGVARNVDAQISGVVGALVCLGDGAAMLTGISS